MQLEECCGCTGGVLQINPPKNWRGLWVQLKGWREYNLSNTDDAAGRVQGCKWKGRRNVQLECMRCASLPAFSLGCTRVSGRCVNAGSWEECGSPLSNLILPGLILPLPSILPLILLTSPFPNLILLTSSSSPTSSSSSPHLHPPPPHLASRHCRPNETTVRTL